MSTRALIDSIPAVDLRAAVQMVKFYEDSPTGAAAFVEMVCNLNLTASESRHLAAWIASAANA